MGLVWERHGAAAPCSASNVSLEMDQTAMAIKSTVCVSQKATGCWVWTSACRETAREAAGFCDNRLVSLIRPDPAPDILYPCICFRAGAPSMAAQHGSLPNFSRGRARREAALRRGDRQRCRRTAADGRVQPVARVFHEPADHRVE